MLVSYKSRGNNERIDSLPVPSVPHKVDLQYQLPSVSN